MTGAGSGPEVRLFVVVPCHNEARGIAATLAALAAQNDRDYFSSTPVVVTWEELNSTPDRCAMHLVAQLYRDFGYLEDKLPREYDPQTGVLRFPR